MDMKNVFDEKEIDKRASVFVCKYDSNVKNMIKGEEVEL